MVYLGYDSDIEPGQGSNLLPCFCHKQFINYKQIGAITAGLVVKRCAKQFHSRENLVAVRLYVILVCVQKKMTCLLI